MNKKNIILLSVLSATVAVISVGAGLFYAKQLSKQPKYDDCFSWVKNNGKYYCTYKNGEFLGRGVSEKLESAKELAITNALHED